MGESFDDIGLLLPIAADTAQALCRVVDGAYEKHPESLIEPAPRLVRRAYAQNIANAQWLMQYAYLVSSGRFEQTHPSHLRRGSDTTRDQTHRPLGNQYEFLMAASGRSTDRPLAVPDRPRQTGFRPADRRRDRFLWLARRIG